MGLVYGPQRASGNAIFGPEWITGGSVALTPGPAALTLGAFAPSVVLSGNTSLVPGPATLNLAAFAPALARTGSTNLVPGPASLAMTTFAPTVAQTMIGVFTPGPATMAAATFAPSMVRTGSVSFTPGPATFSLHTAAPTVVANGSPILVSAPARYTLTRRLTRRLEIPNVSTISNPGFDDKDPGERVPIAFNFAKDLAALGGAVLAGSPTVTVTRFSGAEDPTPAAMIDGSPWISGTKVMQWVHGGLAGCTYHWRCDATTDTGAVLAMAGTMTVRTK